jgi:glycosyltransferase involved in cell wall biosynthesis
LKIAIVSYEFPPHNGTGGVAFYSHNLAKLLSSNHQVVVFSGSNLEVDNPYQENNTEGYISVVVNAKDDRSFIVNVLAIFEKYHLKDPFDLIESPEVGACALHIKQKYNDINLVVKLHTPLALLGYYTLKNSDIKFKITWGLKSLLSLGKVSARKFYITPKQRDIEYKITEIASAIYSPSNALIDELNRLWNLDKPITRIPNYYPIDLARSLSIYDAKKKSIKQKLEISFIGKLTFLKGADTIFELISDLLITDDNVQINIIGDDGGDLFGRKYFQKYNAIVKHHKVKLMNRVPNEDVLEILKKTHILLVPSLWENQPTIIFEGIANGCLVLANNIGGIKEQLTEFGDGYLIDGNNKKEYLNLINNISTDHSIYDLKVKKAIMKMSSIFSKEEFLDRQEKFYKNIIESNSRS